MDFFPALNYLLIKPCKFCITTRKPGHDYGDKVHLLEKAFVEIVKKNKFLLKLIR